MLGLRLAAPSLVTGCSPSRMVPAASIRPLRRGSPSRNSPSRGTLPGGGGAAGVETDGEGGESHVGGAPAPVSTPIPRAPPRGGAPPPPAPALNSPAELHRLYGHLHCGIYVQVKTGGAVK